MFTFLKNVINGIFFSTNKKSEDVPQAPYKVEVSATVEETKPNQLSVSVGESVAVAVTPVESVQIKQIKAESVEVKTEEKPKRARDKKGRMKADDKTTEIVNEAWVGGKAPSKKAKGPAPVKTVKTTKTTAKEKSESKTESKPKKMRVVNVNK